MRILLILTFFFHATFCFSQTLFPEAQKIKYAFEKLSADSNNQKLQIEYIESFPSDTKSFLKVFQTYNSEQLYSVSFEYLGMLKQCAENFPEKVLSKCIDIGKNLVWEADAVGGLQHLSVEIAVKNVNIFVEKYKTLNSKEQNHLIKFYADVENHRAYTEYQDMIEALKSVGEMNIARKFEKARAIRIKEKDH